MEGPKPDDPREPLEVIADDGRRRELERRERAGAILGTLAGEITTFTGHILHVRSG